MTALPTSFKALADRLQPRAIHSEREYDRAVAMIRRLLALPRLNREQEAYLDTLSLLVEAYEAEHHAIETRDLSPLDTLRYLLDEHGMTGSDLGRLLGTRTLGPAILSGRRQLSKANIVKLCEHFKVGPEAFWPGLGEDAA